MNNEEEPKAQYHGGPSPNTQPRAEDAILKTIDVSSGSEKTTEITVDVPEDKGDGKAYSYTVRVNAEELNAAVMDNKIAEFWTKLEVIVLNDINEV